IRADFLLKEYPEFAYLDDAVLKSSCAVGFPKSKTKVRDEFNIFLKEIRENGIYDEMYDRWIINGDESVMPLIENTGTNGTIRIGSTFESIPFSFMKNNEYYGFDVELMLRYAASLNKKPVFSDYNFSGLLAAAATEKVDVIAASIMATEERAKQIAFSDNYFTGHSGLIVLSENLAGNNNKTNAPSKNKKKQKEESYFTSLNDVAKKRIAVMVGSTHDQFISSNYPNATIVRIDNAPDLTLALKTGQCDAIVLDENTAKLYLEADNQLGVLERDIFKEEYGFGFNNQELRDDVNIYLNELISSGQNQLIIEKWSNDDGSMQIPDFNNKGENGTLKIGTTGTDIPFSYIKENKDAGIDMEIIYGYAASKGLKPEVSIMPFGSLLAAATSKKVDVIVSAITITEERKKQLFFSDTYYGSNAIALTLKKNLPPEERSSGLNLRTVDDLQDKRIGVLLGSAQDMFVSSKFKNAELYRMDHSVDLVALLQQGQCDAILLNDIEAIYLMAEHPEFAYLQKNVSKESYVIGFPKSATKERDEFNVFLKDIKDSGLYDEIYNRWIFNANEAVMPMIENDGKNGILKVGTTLEEVPYSFIKNGEYAGFDIELMLRYAAYINKKAEFIHYNFSGMLAAVISDKVDVIANAIMETEERAKNISFSNEYIDVPSGIIVLNKNLASSQDDEKESKSWFTRVKESFHNNIIKEKRYLLLWDGLKVTFIISVLSAILGTLLGALICWMRMSKNKIVKTIALVYIDILRGIPQVVLLMLMFYVVFASWNIGGVAVAVITFAMNFAAYVSEMFRTSIQSIKKGQTEAGIAMGFSKVKTFFNIIMPQAIQRVIPVYKGEFIGLVKMTSIVGYIAVQDLTKASDIIRSRTFDAFFPLIVISIIYFLLAWLLTLLIDMIQIKVAPKRK
ncbi:ABC transporter permease subunit, partial [Bacteroidales bacterium OttesenSCG-928-K03]|nr:ABC transporter permease subunit [Bacteroidales bacterium OttesenSCG-928-K03]